MKQFPKIPQLRKIPKKILLLSSSIVLLMAVAVCSTLAFMTAKTKEATNKFNPGIANITVSEPNGSSYTLSSNTVSKVVLITNPSSKIGIANPVPVYVRARLVPIMRYAANSGVEGTGESVKNVKYSYPNKDWILIGDYYYYKKILNPGEKTTELIDSATVSGGLSSGRNLEIQVIADSVQVEGNAVKEAWNMEYSNNAWVSLNPR